jgi:putative membrane protein
MTPLQQIAYITRTELRAFVRYPKMLVAAAAVALLPALYALIYLSSVWDPASKTQSLAVALVNLDEGVEYRDHVFNVGWQVVSKLRSSHRFGYEDLHDAEEARHRVRQGSLAFALIIPRDFSSNAIPGAQPGGGKLVIYSAEGNNYETAVIARQFATELGHEVNESLNERRWALVLSNAAGSQHSVEQLRQGVQQLRLGAEQLKNGSEQTVTAAKTLSHGAGRLQGGVEQLTDGMRQLSAGLRTMDARRAPNSELNRLKNGAEALASGHAELSRGMDELQTGSQKIREGVSGFQEEANGSMLVSTRVKDNANQLANGVNQLDDGLKTASNAQRQLAEGADKVSVGVGALTTGMRGLSGGIRTAVSKLPEDSQLDELNRGASALVNGNTALADGLQKVHVGAQAVSGGLDLLASSLPEALDTPGGSAAGMASSVQPVMELSAPVSNSGSGFAPNILPAALWLGAGIAAFLIHVRTLPRRAQHFSRPAQLLGKMGLPATVVVVQSLLLGAAVQQVLTLQVAHAPAFALTLAVSGLSFLAMVMLLTKAFGDAGKAMAMVLLAVQLSSSGGVMPVELSGGLFAKISPWLPMTWVVRAVKASLFGAFDGEWALPLAYVAASGTAAVLLSMLVGRWRFVKTTAMRPAIDI